ncbi:MAG TPA: ABC transporter ATP-binding protein [Caulobacteraceae bacterium]|nr:ABC transporter ATP-binding protein [Caulobacteraceae bacterium]
MVESLIERRGDVIQVQGLTKRFGGMTAISDIALDLAPGQVLGFVGPNGAGKTTTLRVLAGLLRADSGSGRVLGHDLMTAHGLVSEQVGYMPQRLALYGELTVAQNLRFRADVYGLPDPRAAVEAAIEDFDLARFRHRRATLLSGGWARKLQLAAALIHQPRLILLDEPTAGLDADSRLDVWRRVLALARAGASVVINTHDLAEAEQCTAIALFSDGRILARGDPDALTRDASFQALVLRDADVDRLAGPIANLSGVMGIFPQGHRLRVLARPHAGETIAALATSMGARVEPCEKRLEDTAFVITHDARPHHDARLPRDRPGTTAS